VLIYTFFAAATVAGAKPTLEAGINGGWLLTVASTESLAVLGIEMLQAIPPAAFHAALLAWLALSRTLRSEV
jgi:hypothetical protein